MSAQPEPEPDLYRGALAVRIDGDLAVVLYRFVFNDRLCAGPVGSYWYARGFCYPHDEAWQAFAEWSGEGDPPGNWIKESGTERYRVPGIGQPGYQGS